MLDLDNGRFLCWRQGNVRASRQPLLPIVLLLGLLLSLDLLLKSGHFGQVYSYVARTPVIRKLFSARFTQLRDLEPLKRLWDVDLA